MLNVIKLSVVMLIVVAPLKDVTVRILDPQIVSLPPPPQVMGQYTQHLIFFLTEKWVQ